MTPIGSHESAEYVSWTDVRDALRARGLRWTPQRRTLIDVLSHTEGHVTGAGLVESCRAIDPTSTEDVVQHAHDASFVEGEAAVPQAAEDPPSTK